MMRGITLKRDFYHLVEERFILYLKTAIQLNS